MDKDKIWHEVLESLKVSISSAAFSTWLNQTHLSALKELDTQPPRFIVEIGCQTTFVRQTVEVRYFGLIQEALTQKLGMPCDLSFTTRQNPNTGVFNTNKVLAPLFDEKNLGQALIEKLSQSHLRPFFTFDNFAVSASNQMAWAAAQAVAEKPGSTYNPLFLWGGVGVGKTHLMNAVGLSIINSIPESKILLCTGEDFTNDIVAGIRTKTTHAFRDKYRRLACLLIDDIQFIAGKDSVQEEFFHTFNAVTGAGGQIILTSDRPPSDITKLEERLRSRFEAGLIVDISPADFELRCAIVQIKAAEKSLEIPTELVHLLAGNLDTARKINGVLTRLISEVKLQKRVINEELIKSLIGKGSNGDTINKNIRADDVVEAVCSHFTISKRALMGDGRSRIIARPRQILMYFLRIELGLPLEEVGKMIGGRDHTTVMHAVDKITNLASIDVNIREDLMGIKRRFSGQKT
ncbi:MAG: Chromosomal replication initiator protein DnaA [Candidatus Woesebacteria bacterium GW2011_GWB1_38_5b]|uniref:Chromosomal replication initiator protein DnaA n=1 Tax=Candidatus Woesebacteria bacterium GW2011_GWB1_38_5b TaxID=1618569 RepID=A0A0G0NCU6_9BACT|nr:MAG: Chromosomal replication initiator protein DnaA [Candidatus Woesebacteria bacterium GW2011_GWB1_38_5b]